MGERHKGTLNSTKNEYVNSLENIMIDLKYIKKLIAENCGEPVYHVGNPMRFVAEQLLAEVERTQPIVESAKALRDEHTNPRRCCCDVCKTVDVIFVKKFRGERHRASMTDRLQPSETDQIDKLIAIRNVALEEAIILINDIDPLKANADWESNESIAYGVRDFIVNAIRQRILRTSDE